MHVILKTAMVLTMAAVLTGCPENSGDPFIGDTNAASKSAQINAPYTIAISVPQIAAISQLEGAAAGFYSTIGSAIVTDQNGNPAPDGTIVHLDAIDTIIAKGTADSMTGTVLTDSAPTLADGATGTSFTTAAVTRDGTQRFIEKDDLVLITSGADSADKNQVIASNPSSMTSLDVARAYSKTYPSTAYPASSYIVGQSLMGVSMVGIDADGKKTPGIATTKDGIAGFRMEYPANSSTIHLGCNNPAADTRFTPSGSADVYVIARLDDHSVTTVSNQFCFFSILPWAMKVVPEALSASGTVTLTLEDAKSVRLPNVALSAGIEITGATFNVTATSCTTGSTAVGQCQSTITVAGGATGDTATVTYSDSAGNASAVVTVTKP